MRFAKKKKRKKERRLDTNLHSEFRLIPMMYFSDVLSPELKWIYVRYIDRKKGWETFLIGNKFFITREGERKACNCSHPHPLFLQLISHRVIAPTLWLCRKHAPNTNQHDLYYYVLTSSVKLSLSHTYPTKAAAESATITLIQWKY